MTETNDVYAIAVEWLELHGYDGLSDGDECSCSFRSGNELALCGELQTSCEPCRFVFDQDGNFGDPTCSGPQPEAQPWCTREKKSSRNNSSCGHFTGRHNAAK